MAQCSTLQCAAAFSSQPDYWTNIILDAWLEVTESSDDGRIRACWCHRVSVILTHVEKFAQPETEKYCAENFTRVRRLNHNLRTLLRKWQQCNKALWVSVTIDIGSILGF